MALKKSFEKASDIFECKMCGDCCQGYGGTYVTEKDIEAISEYIDEKSELFIETYCNISGKRPVLSQGEDGKCIFFKEKCTIHPVKPRMCRAWPFIEGVYSEPSNWALMSGVCRGIKSDVPLDVVKEIVGLELKKE